MISMLCVVRHLILRAKLQPELFQRERSSARGEVILSGSDRIFKWSSLMACKVSMMVLRGLQIAFMGAEGNLFQSWFLVAHVGAGCVSDK